MSEDVGGYLFVIVVINFYWFVFGNGYWNFMVVVCGNVWVCGIVFWFYVGVVVDFVIIFCD